VHKDEGEEEEEEDPSKHQLSFKGCGMMQDGKIQGGNAVFMRGDGFRYSFESMENGRPYGKGKFYNDDFA
jgi:hypothetical protein